MNVFTLVTAVVLSITYPSPVLTPGDVMANVTAAMVCTPGYTSTVRHVPLSVRNAVLHAYGYIGPASAIELDHLISLEVGGSNSARNLWPEPIADARIKDIRENQLHREVCAGHLRLREAQEAILREWGPRIAELPANGPLFGGAIPLAMPHTGGGGGADNRIVADYHAAVR